MNVLACGRGERDDDLAFRSLGAIAARPSLDGAIRPPGFRGDGIVLTSLAPTSVRRTIRHVDRVFCDEPGPALANCLHVGGTWELPSEEFTRCSPRHARPFPVPLPLGDLRRRASVPFRRSYDAANTFVHFDGGVREAPERFAAFIDRLARYRTAVVRTAVPSDVDLAARTGAEAVQTSAYGTTLDVRSARDGASRQLRPASARTTPSTLGAERSVRTACGRAPSLKTIAEEPAPGRTLFGRSISALAAAARPFRKAVGASTFDAAVNGPDVSPWASFGAP